MVFLPDNTWRSSWMANTVGQSIVMCRLPLESSNMLLNAQVRFFFYISCYTHWTHTNDVTHDDGHGWKLIFIPWWQWREEFFFFFQEIQPQRNSAHCGGCPWVFFPAVRPSFPAHVEPRKSTMRFFFSVFSRGLETAQREQSNFVLGLFWKREKKNGNTCARKSAKRRDAPTDRKKEKNNFLLMIVVFLHTHWWLVWGWNVVNDPSVWWRAR